MLRERGFTLVELSIVMVVMAILMTIGMVSLSSSQKDARDKARTTTVDTIARGLESFYNGDATGTVGAKGGVYPASDQMLASATDKTTKQILPGLNDSAYYYPFQGDTPALQARSASNSLTSSNSSVNIIIYEPLTRSNALCTTASSMECSQFKLYYRLESAPSTIITVQSNRR